MVFFPLFPAFLFIWIGKFPAAVDSRTEPILVTGMYGEGDVLLVRCRSDSSAVFVYDPWRPGAWSLASAWYV